MNRVIIFSWYNSSPDLPFEADRVSASGQARSGWTELVQLLAYHVGIFSKPVNNNKRVLAYMKGLEKLPPGSFFSDLFKQDPLVTTQFLLNQRDELKWYVKDFSSLEKISERLKNFAVAEQLTNYADVRGIADIYQELCLALEKKPQLKMTLTLSEDEKLYPPYAGRLIDLLPGCGIEIIRAHDPTPAAPDGTNLNVFQKQLLCLLKDEAPSNVPFRADDDSLILFKSKYLTDAGNELRAFMDEKRENGWYILRPPSDIQVSETLRSQKGTQAEIRSEVSSLPVIQVLQSFCNMIWKPFDVEAVFEFLSLPVKPFPEALANRLADALLTAPGVNSSKWTETLKQYREEVPSDDEEKQERLRKANERYKWWFEQELFDPDEGVLIPVFKERLGWIREWATNRAAVEEKDELTKSLFQELAALCLEISDLSDTMATENRLTRFDLDKLVSLVFSDRMMKTMHYSKGTSGIQNSIATEREVDRLFWWDCSGNWENIDVPDFLWQDEIVKLNKSGVQLFTRKDATRLLRYAMIRKVLSVKKRLILSWSEYNGTSYNFPHSFWLYLLNLPEQYNAANLVTRELCAGAYLTRNPLPISKPQNIVRVNGLNSLLPRERESYSSIASMIYYPHIYVFENVLGLRDWLRSSLTLDALLKGSIIHKFAEIALNDKELLKGRLSKEKWEQWCDNNLQPFIDKEASLLNKSKHSVDRTIMKYWMREMLFYLFEGITTGGWKVEAVEYPFEKQFNDHTSITGRTDLIITRAGKRLVVDLKSGGSGYKEKEIQKNADWQLLLYSYFGHPGVEPAESAFFIVMTGQLIGRTDPGISHFRKVAPKPEAELSYSEMLTQLRTAIAGRISQLSNGDIEFRMDKNLIEMLPESFAGIAMSTTPNSYDSFNFLNTI